uniref:Uncharacterized protein n=1 Tax=Tanacetum cinerariifolium TaxID=118510 RepID=A0A699IB73_TANCI|nr:hypothetical protein [Tanacetum cinerariifolium]
MMDLAVQFDNASTAKHDLRQAYEKCNDIPQETRTLTDTFLKQESDKDYEMNLAISTTDIVVVVDGMTVSTLPRNSECSNVERKNKGLKDVKFSREAIDAVGVNKKLYMVNGKEEAVYDMDIDTWTDMLAEMLAG